MYNKETGLVASYSEGANKTDSFDQIELEITEEQLEMIQQNNILYIKDGNLDIIETEKNKGLKSKQEFFEKAQKGEVEVEDITNYLAKI